jgi:hypothetical protein
MDNLNSSPSPFSSCVLKLDSTQYAFYQNSRLEIHSPEDKWLTTIAKPIANKTDDDAIYQLWCQVCLLEVLFEQVLGNVKLPQNALDYIVIIMGRIERHIKKQMQM